MKNRITICIAGKNDIACNCLQYLINNTSIPKSSILALPIDSDENIDRWQRSYLKFSLDHGIKLTSLKELYQVNNLIFVSLEYDKIIQPQKFKSKNLFNIHFSLLPKYRGMYTSIWPILNNENETGVTLHRIDPGIDTGNVIASIRFKIEKNDTSRAIYFKNLKYGQLLFEEQFPNLLSGNIIEIKQEESMSSYYSKGSIIFEKLNINLNCSSIELYNQVRAYNFREYQTPKVHGYNISHCIKTKLRSTLNAGSIIQNTFSYLKIATLDFDCFLFKDYLDNTIDLIKNGEDELASLFINSIYDINERTRTGSTLLIESIKANNKTLTKLLLLKGADISICDYTGTKPLQYARSEVIIELLKTK